MLTCPHCGKEIAKPRKPYHGTYKEYVPLIIDCASKGWSAYDIAVKILELRYDTRRNARELIQQSVYNIARINGYSLGVRQPSTSPRNLEIYRQRMAGMTFKSIGEIHGIGAQRARQIALREIRKQKYG